MEIDNSRGLIVFLKPPEAGAVKTRLARDVGDEEALKIYKQLINHTLHVINGVNAFKYIFLSQKSPFDVQLPLSTYSIHYQEGKDLGERMSNAFFTVFEEGVSQAMIIGSDNIQLTPPILDEAFDALFSNDMVIGPSNDGGYYLLGLNELEPSLFEGVEWSTGSVYESTIERADRATLTVKILETLPDIDHWRDLQESNWRNYLDENKWH